jgi:hypothetical protein
VFLSYQSIQHDVTPLNDLLVVLHRVAHDGPPSTSQPNLRSLADTSALLTQEGPYVVDSLKYRLSGLVDKSNPNAVFVLQNKFYQAMLPRKSFRYLFFYVDS